MYLSAEEISWPETAVFIALLIGTVVLVMGAVAAWLEFRKQKLTNGQQEDLRQLVRRYEQLAENTMDAQQRIAADVADLRTRAASIEQILRTVE